MRKLEHVNEAFDFVLEGLFQESKALKPYQKILIKTIKSFYLSKFRIKPKITVRSKPSKKYIGDVTLSDNTINNHKFTLNFDGSLSFEMQIKSLFHELTHIKQITLGELLPSDDYQFINWFGKEYISVKEYNKLLKSGNHIKYNALPWEDEAIKQSILLRTEFLKSSEFNSMYGKDSLLDMIMDEFINESFVLERLYVDKHTPAVKKILNKIPKNNKYLPKFGKVIWNRINKSIAKNSSNKAFILKSSDNEYVVLDNEYDIIKTAVNNLDLESFNFWIVSNSTKNNIHFSIEFIEEFGVEWTSADRLDNGMLSKDWYDRYNQQIVNLISLNQSKIVYTYLNYESISIITFTIDGKKYFTMDGISGKLYHQGNIDEYGKKPLDLSMHMFNYVKKSNKSNKINESINLNRVNEAFDFVLEGKKVDPNDNQLEFVTNSPEFYDNRSEFISIVKNETAMLYHGTNVDFKKFDLKMSKDLRNDNYWGKGVFLTANESVAWKYAGAGFNQHLDKSILDKAKKVDKELGALMLDFYKNGFSGFQDTDKKYPKIYKNGGTFNGLDLNEISDIVQLIPNNQLTKDYSKNNNSDNDFISPSDLFGTSSSALGYYQIRDLKQLGLGDYRERILITVLDTKGAEIFITKSQQKAKKSKADIIIAYDNKDLVDGRPEIIVRDPKRIKIVDVDYMEYDESLNEMKISKHFVNEAKISDDNKPFDPKKTDLYADFSMLNAKLFNNELNPIKLKWFKSKLKAGEYVYTGSVPNELKISTYFNMTRQQYLDILAHEMIHHLELTTFNKFLSDGHGKFFMNKLNEINKNNPEFNVTKTENAKELKFKVRKNVGKLKTYGVLLLDTGKDEKMIVAFNEKAFSDTKVDDFIETFKKYMTRYDNIFKRDKIVEMEFYKTNNPEISQFIIKRELSLRHLGFQGMQYDLYKDIKSNDKLLAKEKFK